MISTASGYNLPMIELTAIAGLSDCSMLDEFECFWRDLQVWLAGRGYMLRARYRPGWVASWKCTGERPLRCEDSLRLRHPSVIDATRISDGETVVLKKVNNVASPYEKKISLVLSSEPYRSHPRNHCDQLIEVLDVPNTDISILVMPLLHPFHKPRFETVGEVLECFRQLLEGLQLLHECRVAHRDITFSNIMMEAEGMFPEPYHFVDSSMNQQYTRTVRKPRSRAVSSPKYYIIDFGMSRQYSREEGPFFEPSIIAVGDCIIPEHTDPSIPQDPFQADIYCMGNVMRQVTVTYTGLDFLQPLIMEMVEDPTQGPNIHEVVENYRQIIQSRRWWHLRAGLRYLEDEKDASN